MAQGQALPHFGEAMAPGAAPSGGSGGTPAGTNREVQYNNNGIFGGAAGFETGNTNNRVLMQAQSATEVPLRLQMAAAQTADGFQIKNSSGIVKTSIDKDGTDGHTILGNWKIWRWCSVL